MKKLKLALIGRDVSKSDSEKIHRFILERKGVSCDYEKVSVGADGFIREAKRLLREKDGFNVTIPYKQEVISTLGALKGDAKEFYSVNTVLSAAREGYNTDGIGFLLMLGLDGLETKGKRVLVLGAGGAGRSTAAVLKRAGAEVFLYRRQRALLEEACRKTGVNAADSPDMACDVLINCTGVGMHESEGVSPVGAETIEKCGAAVDLIYRPAESEFLRLARSLGKRTLNGGAMLFYQAYYSDCLYLGAEADEREARELYEEYKKTWSEYEGNKRKI